MGRRTGRQIYIDNTLEILKGHVGHSVDFKKYNVDTRTEEIGSGVVLRANINRIEYKVEIYLSIPEEIFPIMVYDWELRGCECGKPLVGTCKVGNK